jgi:hypothetical protein
MGRAECVEVRRRSRGDMGDGRGQCTGDEPLLQNDRSGRQHQRVGHESAGGVREGGKELWSRFRLR